MIENDDTTTKLLIRGLGVLIGVLASLIFIAPAATRNVFYRVAVSIAMGFIFAPVLPHVWGFNFLAGSNLELVMARGAAMGFSIWSILELIARLLSSTEWLERLAKEIIRLRAGGRNE